MVRGTRSELKADTDAIVGVDVTIICGTDLHILKGDTPEVTPGRILGHGAVVVVPLPAVHRLYTRRAERRPRAASGRRSG